MNRTLFTLFAVTLCAAARMQPLGGALPFQFEANPDIEHNLKESDAVPRKVESVQHTTNAPKRGQKVEDIDVGDQEEDGDVHCRDPTGKEGNVPQEMHVFHRIIGQRAVQRARENLIELFLPNPIELHDAIHVPRDVNCNDQREEEPKDVDLDHDQQHKGTTEIGKTGHDLLRSGGAEMFGCDQCGVIEIKMKIGFARYHDHDAIYNEPAETVQAGGVRPPLSGRVRVKLDLAERGVVVISVVLRED